MSIEERVLDYTIETLSNYSLQSSHSLVDLLIKDGIVTKKDRKHASRIFIGDLTEREGIKQSITKNSNTIKTIEKWEFNKNYRYSMLFEAEVILDQTINDLLKNGDIQLYSDKGDFEELYPITMKPSLVRNEGMMIFKFNVKLEALDTFEIKHKRRYPILAIYNLNEQLLELRFDSIENVFACDKFRFIYEALAWIRQYLLIRVTPLDLKEVCDYISKNGRADHIIPSGQDMRLSSGAKATIEIGNDDSMVLPFIGELKNIMQQYSAEFDEAPALKEVLEDFIYEKENLSEFPWMKFHFEEHKFDVKFTFDYGKENACLIQHMHSQLKANMGKERMDSVTEYIIKIRKDISSLFFEQERSI